MLGIVYKKHLERFHWLLDGQTTVCSKLIVPKRFIWKGHLRSFYPYIPQIWIYSWGWLIVCGFWILKIRPQIKILWLFKKFGKICENHFLTMLAQLTFKRLLSNNKLFLVYKNIIKTKFLYIFLFNSFIHSFKHSYISWLIDYGSIGFISLELFKKSLLLDSNLLNVDCVSMVRKWFSQILPNFFEKP